MKQIKIEQLLPLLKSGWVAYAPNYGWMWFDETPMKLQTMYYLDYPHREFIQLSDPFKELAPFDGDWKDSLIKVEHKEEQ